MSVHAYGLWPQCNIELGVLKLIIVNKLEHIYLSAGFVANISRATHHLWAVTHHSEAKLSYSLIRGVAEFWVSSQNHRHLYTFLHTWWVGGGAIRIVGETHSSLHRSP